MASARSTRTRTVFPAAPIAVRSPDSEPSTPRLAAQSGPATPAECPTTQPTSEETDTVTTIHLTIGGTQITGELEDDPTAQDLARQLPVEVTLADFKPLNDWGRRCSPRRLRRLRPLRHHERVRRRSPTSVAGGVTVVRWLP